MTKLFEVVFAIVMTLIVVAIRCVGILIICLLFWLAVMLLTNWLHYIIHG